MINWWTPGKHLTRVLPAQQYASILVIFTAYTVALIQQALQFLSGADFTSHHSSMDYRIQSFTVIKDLPSKNAWKMRKKRGHSERDEKKKWGKKEEKRMKNLWRALSHSGEVSRGEGTQVPREIKRADRENIMEMINKEGKPSLDMLWTCCVRNVFE